MPGEIESNLPSAQYLESFKKKQSSFSGSTEMTLDVLLPKLFWDENYLLKELIKASIPVDTIERTGVFTDKITFEGKLVQYSDSSKNNGEYTLRMKKTNEGKAESIHLEAMQNTGTEDLVKLAVVLNAYVSLAEQKLSEKQKPRQATI